MKFWKFVSLMSFRALIWRNSEKFLIFPAWQMNRIKTGDKIKSRIALIRLSLYERLASITCRHAKKKKKTDRWEMPEIKNAWCWDIREDYLLENSPRMAGKYTRRQILYLETNGTKDALPTMLFALFTGEDALSRGRSGFFPFLKLCGEVSLLARYPLSYSIQENRNYLQEREKILPGQIA